MTNPRVGLRKMSNSNESGDSNIWIDNFLYQEGNSHFCAIDASYILDRFNLTGLPAEVLYFSQALDLIVNALEGTIKRPNTLFFFVLFYFCQHLRRRN